MTRPPSGPALTADSGGMATGVALSFITVMIWGLQFPIAKSAFEHIDPFHLALFRYAVPGMLLMAVLLAREGLQTLRFDRQAGLATAVGLIGMTGSPALVFGGLSLTRPEIVAIIIAIQPSMTAVVLWVLRGQRPDGFSLLCILIAFFGVVTVITGWTMEFANHPTELLGDLLVLAGALCWVIYTIAGERFATWSVLRYTTLTMLPGAIGHAVLVTTLTGLGILTTPSLAQWTAAGWQTAYLALLGVLASMLMWNAGIKRIGSLNAMLFVNLIPVVTFAVRYWQGVEFTILELTGAAMVVAALIANNLWMRKKVISQRALLAAQAAARQADESGRRAG